MQPVKFTFQTELPGRGGDVGDRERVLSPRTWDTEPDLRITPGVGGTERGFHRPFPATTLLGE